MTSPQASSSAPTQLGPASTPSRLRVTRIIGRLNIGGPAIQAITLTHELDSIGYQTTLMRGSESPSEGSMDDLVETLGVHPVLIPELRRDPSWCDLPALAVLTNALIRQRPHVVHTHAAKAGTLGRVASILASVVRPMRTRPVRVHTFHGHSLTGYFSPRVSAVYRLIEKVLARRTDRLIAVSEEVRDELVTMGVAESAKFVVIPLGFDLERFLRTGTGRAEARDAVRLEMDLQPDAVVVTLIARLVPIKRVDRFLRAARILSETSGVRFLIVGDGELRDELVRSDDAQALAGRLTWAGFRRDIAEVCFASDIVVLCSDNEGTPVSLIEASAAGVPVISTRVGGAAKVVRDGVTGRLVQADDGSALAAAIAELACDTDLRKRIGAAAREHAVTTFSLDRLVRDIDDLYRQLLAGR